MALSRRAFIEASLGSGLATSLGRPAWAQPDRSVRLGWGGAERQLPDRWCGYNSPANYEIPIEDPEFRKAVIELRPQLLRFPGGTTANYYQPETGQLDFGSGPSPSVYRRFLRQYAGPSSRKLHPNGVFVRDYIELCRAMDADLVVVPNLETSSVASQVAWLKGMNRIGFRPDLVEMGNEFYLALLMDPDTIKVFPDYASAMARTKQYVDALRPYMAKDAKVAVQAAGAQFHKSTPANDPRQARELKWDEALKAEPWFDAVTTHLYPTIEASAGSGSVKNIKGDLQRIFDAFMARSDGGYDRSLSDTAARVPGKEIWLTEWGSFEPAGTFSGAKVEFDGLWLHSVARCLFSMLRHPQVTISTTHALFARGDLMSAFRPTNPPSGGGYIPINSASFFHWIFEASRGPDAHYRRVAVDGAKQISAHGTIAREQYSDVEACVFRRGRQHTLFVQNASAAPCRVSLDGLGRGSAKVEADYIATPVLTDVLQSRTPEPVALAGGPEVVVAPYSITRVRWG